MNEFKSWNSYRNFANRVRRKTRYIRTPEDDDFLREVLRTSQNRIQELPADTGLWRAQLGHDWRPFCQDGQYIDDLPTAYPPERMKPLPGRATEGRANPKGIPVLYLSTHRKTAMSEVRPWLGSLLSCAHFRTTRTLKIVDFSVHRRSRFVLYFSEPDASKRGRGGLEADRPGVLRTHDRRGRYRRLCSDAGNHGALQERRLRRHRIQERLRKKRATTSSCSIPPTRS